MVVRVKDILRSIDCQAPFALAESWDNVGLLVGDAEREVTGVMVGLDPTHRLLDEAIAKGANTVVTHHPVIFKPLPAIDTSTAEGQLLEKALGNKISIIAAHTNFDSAVGGVSAVLARHLGLVGLAPLVPVGQKGGAVGLGCIGSYPAALAARDFMSRLFHTLQMTKVRMAGALPAVISTVAICGGSGSEFAQLARSLGANVYLSAEIKHSTAVWAVENGYCVIDGSHYATEKPAVAELAGRMRETAHREHWQISILESTTEHHPFLELEESNPE